MSILFNNSVSNIQSTPGMYSSTFATRPPASNLAIGTIFIATDTGAMYQTNGTNWNSIGGGSGITPGWDTVLDQNQVIGSYHQVNFNAFNFDMYDFGTLQLVSIGGYRLNVSTNFIYTCDAYGKYSGLFCDNTGGVYYIGTGNDTKGNRYEVNDNSSYLQTVVSQNLFGFYVQQNEVIIGDYDVQNTTIHLVNNSQIYTTFNNFQIGFNLDYAGSVYQFGDPTNNSYLVFDASVNSLDIFASNYVTIYTDSLQLNTNLIQVSGSVLQSTSGGSSGQHLQITIGGTPYVIALLNP